MFLLLNCIYFTSVVTSQIVFDILEMKHNELWW